MQHIKAAMIVSIVLLLLGFCVSTLSGIWWMYEEGIKECQKVEQL